MRKMKRVKRKDKKWKRRWMSKKKWLKRK